MVPNGWERKPVKDLCESIIDCVNKTAKHVDFETPYKMIRTTNVRNGKVDTKNVRYVEVEIYKHWIRRGAPKNGDIIFTREAPVGEVGILEDANGIFLGQRTMMYRAHPQKCDNRFLLYSFLTGYCQKQIKDFSNGGTVAHMRVPDCGEIIVDLPPLPEQQKIAKIISTWDKAIATTEKLIESSKQQKKALMQQLLTGKKRLINTETGVAFEGDWEEVKLGDVCSKITDGAHQSPKSVDIGYPMYSVKDMSPSGFTENSARHISQSDFDILVNQNCKPDINDILIAKDGSILKYCFVVKRKIEGVILSSIALLRPKMNKVFPGFVAQYFSQEYIKIFVGKALTSGSGVPRIILKDFKGIHLKIPSVNEQQKINSVLTTADKEIEILDAKLAYLQQEKKALMQQLLTGKRRVKVEKELEITS